MAASRSTSMDVMFILAFSAGTILLVIARCFVHGAATERLYVLLDMRTG